MAKLDRLDWAADLRILHHGLAIGIRSNNAECLRGLQARLPFGWAPARSHRVDRLYSLVGGGAAASPNVRRLNLVYANAVRLGRSRELADVVRALEVDLERYVAEHARRRLFLHAGVVGWCGRAIVIPGRSMSGKSTLVAALVDAGATYYSDEYAVLDGRGRVFAYPRPLRLRDGGAAVVVPDATAAGDAERPTLPPLPIGIVVVTRYRPRARWRPRRLSAGQAGIAMLGHTVAARLRPAHALAVLRRAVSTSVALDGPRGEAADCVGAMLRAMTAFAV